MRVRGKVVGNTVVLESEGALPQGAVVEVFLAEDAEGWDVDAATWQKLDEARASLQRGEGVDLDEVLVRLEAEVD